MNKAYIIFPLIGILIFGGFYLNFSKGYEANIAAAKARVEEAKKEKIKKDAENKTAAVQAAIAAQALRAKEKEEKVRIDEAKKTARQDAEDRRARTYEDRNRLREQVNRLKKDLDEIKGTFGKIEEEKKTRGDELTFLKTYVKQAEANVKYYYDLLDKIAVADKARAEAAAAAAALAKKG